MYGVHSYRYGYSLMRNSTLTVTPHRRLVEGAIYTIAVGVRNQAGHTVSYTAQQDRIAIRSAPATVTAPTSGAKIGANPVLEFTLPDDAVPGTLLIIFTRAGDSHIPAAASGQPPSSDGSSVTVRVAPAMSKRGTHHLPLWLEDLTFTGHSHQPLQCRA